MSHRHASLLRLVTAAALTAAAPLQAEDLREPVALATQEQRAVSHLEQLPEPALKSFYLACNRSALGGSLGSGEIALCSIGYETLLRRSFGGDLMALLAWSRQAVAPQR